ncbi:MAG: CDP-glycerol glycerophosphotransferase family protein [Promethearchaeota archaeon]
MGISKNLNSVLKFISAKIGMNVTHIIAFLLSKLISININDNLLIFGSTNGKAFSGNCRTVFEYLAKNTEYYCVWITDSKEIYHKIKMRGYHVILNDNLIKVIKLLKAAHFIFFSHGFGDILLIDFSSKTQLIYLAHGISFKRGGYDLKKSVYPFFERRLNDILAKRISFMIDSSDETKKTKISNYRMDPEKIIITGYPRNDILINFTQELIFDLKKRFKLLNFHQIILYAPTFRDYEYKIPLTPDFLLELQKFLEIEKKIFLYKPHPFMEKINLSEYKNIRTIDPSVDINDLLIISDVLITDFSSVFYDFLLTSRPIIFFADDLDKYRQVRDFYFDYETFVPGPYVTSGRDLIKMLKNIELWNSKFSEKRKLTRDRFNKFVDGRATERLLKILNLYR